MKKIKKPISVLLAVIMVVGLFSIVPFTVSAAGEPKPVTAATDLGGLGGTNYSVNPGYYQLQNDIELQGYLNFVTNGEYIIDLNGHTLKQNANRQVINISYYNIKLTIMDSSVSQTGTITGGYSSSQGAGIYNKYGTVVFLGGKVTGNTVTGYGSGAGVYNGGTFIMLGGEISGNTNTYSGNVVDNARNSGNFYILNTLPEIEAYSGKNAAKKIGYSVNTAVTGKGTLTATPTTVNANGEIYTVSDDPVNLNVTPNEGYMIESVTYNDGTDHTITPADGNYSFTMPENNVTVSATFVPDPAHFSQNGNTYTIHDATGWNVFCDCLDDNNTYNRFSGKTVMLDADITVSRRVGYDYHDFCGTFDGDGHTLTFNYGSSDNYSDDDYIAPFKNLSTVTLEDGTEVQTNIKNLHINGDIYTSNKYAAGLIAHHWGTVNIENCRSSIIIHSKVSGDGTHGGFEAVAGGTLNIKGCVFDGKLLTTGTTDDTGNCAGFVAWGGENVNIYDSIYAPAAIDTANGEKEVVKGTGDYPGRTFARKTAGSVSNCYYTRILGTEQGKAAHTITAGQDVTLALDGKSTEYDVSGITAYADNSGLKYGNTIFAGNGENVTLALDYDAPTGYKITYTASAGTLQNDVLTMPDENVTVSSTFTMVGDVNLDGYVDIRDATMIQKHLVQLVTLSDAQLLAADTNGDGEVNISDATHLRMYLAQFNVVLGSKQSY